MEGVSTTRGSGWVRSFLVPHHCAPTRYRGWYWPLPSSTTDFSGATIRVT